MRPSDGDDALFETSGDKALSGQPVLVGGVCEACGNVFYPMQHYGCEACGSQRLTRRNLAGRGKLVCSADIHHTLDPRFPAPFTIGTLVCDDGPVLRAVLDVEPGRALAAGTVMAARLVASAEGAETLRFVPVENV